LLLPISDLIPGHIFMRLELNVEFSPVEMNDIHLTLTSHLPPRAGRLFFGPASHFPPGLRLPFSARLCTRLYFAPAPPLAETIRAPLPPPPPVRPPAQFKPPRAPPGAGRADPEVLKRFPILQRTPIACPCPRARLLMPRGSRSRPDQLFTRASIECRRSDLCVFAAKTVRAPVGAPSTPAAPSSQGAGCGTACFPADC
jgi:hypothetical protein